MLHQIGVGALGPVFRTYEPDRDRLVAVKVFRIDLTPEQARSLADELSRAADAGLFHPSIVEPIAAGVEGSVAYNAEEYVAAESLDVAMRHYAPAAIDTVLPFITQLAGAIDFARAAGVGHGALHPRDIFMTPDEARVTGFGVVEALERVGFRAPVRRPYSPPERIAGASWTTPADVFSLAAITYELLTARRPAGLGAEIGSLTPGAVDAATVALHGVLSRAMDESPLRRYPTALAFASALEAAAHGKADAEGPADAPVGVPPDAGRIGAAGLATPAAASGQPPQVLGLRDPVRPSDNEEEGDVEEDIAAERDEDEAHHQLTLSERSEAARREAELEQVADLPMDGDTEVEAEADRYAGDDFLLDAAGAASAPALSSMDDFRGARDVDRRALDDDEVMVNEPPSPLFEPEDLLDREDRPAPAAVRDDKAAAAVALPPAATVHASGPTFGHYESDTGSAWQPTARRWPLALTLILGLGAGFVGGYALWGRPAPAGAGREWSEQAVSPGPSAPGAAAPATAAPGSSASGATAPGSARPGNAAPDAAATATASRPAGGSTAKPAPAPPPAVSEKPSPEPRSPAARGSGGPTTPPPSRAANGTIIVRSTPSGAGVTVNGQWRGRTPLVLERLQYSKYDVRVVQPGYAPARQAVTLSAAQPDQTLSLRLQQAARAAGPGAKPTPSEPAAEAGSQGYTGSVFVDSRPRGASVFIDGKLVGTTPLSVPEVRIGTRVVRLELPDHRIWSSTARVAAGQQSRVTGSLERIQ